MTPEDMAAELSERVDVENMPLPTDAQVASARASFEQEVYSRVADFPTLAGGNAKVHFLHPVGCAARAAARSARSTPSTAPDTPALPVARRTQGAATTSLATTDMYGTTYHLSAQTYTLDTLRAQVRACPCACRAAPCRALSCRARRH